MGSKLISIGCSFTAHTSYPEFKYWDSYLAEYLNLELHNYARGGTGGPTHFYNLIEAVATHGNDIDTIVVGWTQWKRFSFPYISGYKSNLNPPYAPFAKDGKLYKEIYQLYAANERQAVMESIKSAYALMYAVTALADSINAKLIITQLLPALNKEATKFTDGYLYLSDLYRCTEDNEVFWRLRDDKRLIGFPFLNKLGGYSICSGSEWVPSCHTVNKPETKTVIDFTKPDISVSDKFQIDAHPNQEGHKYIFNKYKDAYDELYK